MNLSEVYYEANCKIASIYGSTQVPETGNVTVTVNGTIFIAYFHKVENGWSITRIEKL